MQPAAPLGVAVDAVLAGRQAGTLPHQVADGWSAGAKPWVVPPDCLGARPISSSCLGPAFNSLAGQDTRVHRLHVVRAAVHGADPGGGGVVWGWGLPAQL